MSNVIAFITDFFGKKLNEILEVGFDIAVLFYFQMLELASSTSLLGKVESLLWLQFGGRINGIESRASGIGALLPFFKPREAKGSIDFSETSMEKNPKFFYCCNSLASIPICVNLDGNMFKLFWHLHHFAVFCSNLSNLWEACKFHPIMVEKAA